MSRPDLNGEFLSLDRARFWEEFSEKQRSRDRAGSIAKPQHFRIPLSLRNVGDLISERGIDIIHETVLAFWSQFGVMMAREIMTRRLQQLRPATQ